MALTAKQITNLNNSMSAAQDVNLGTVIGALVDTGTIVSGSVRPDKARYPVDTGLTTVTKAFCSLSGSPTATVVMWATAVAGSTAGDIIINSWKPTAVNDVTPIASTGSATDQFPFIYWMAIGS